MDLRWFSWTLLLLSHGAFAAEKIKICVVENVHTAKRVKEMCPLLSLRNSTVECVIGNDRLSCLRRMTTGDADFTVLEPEDLVAITPYDYKILVTNELRLFSNEKQRFEMVAVVHKNIKSIWDIKGRRFCHPGFKSDADWTKAFSTYFENWVIVKECDPQKSLLENRMSGLSKYFEAACIAGPWSPDSSFDNKLKSKYRNLCALCENPVGCYTSDKYHGRQGALLCLTDNVGDIAWVRLDDTLQHFEVEKVNKEDYSYLCPDGTTRPFGFGKPCIWITKPWPVIVSRSDVAERVSMTIMTQKDKFDSERPLFQLLENYDPAPVSTETLEPPEDYLRRFPSFVGANNRASCRPSRRVQWCVSSNLEDRKCRWLREASFVYGVEPAISCIQQPNRESCFQAVRTNRADIFVAKPEELLAARKKGLKPIIGAMTKKKEELDRIAAVVKKESWFKSLKDLKGAKACFTGYRSVGWNAFATVMKNVSGLNWDCSDAKAIGSFFKDSCVLGLSDRHEDVPHNLYSLCKQGGRAGDDVSAFDCLSSGLGDVAFVNLKAIEKKTGSFDHVSSNPKATEYKILCSSDPSNDNKNSCLLTWTPLASVVAHENITDLRHEEIYAMLLDMDELFGQTFPDLTPAFSMYGMYDLNHSVIFPEETQFLQLNKHRFQRVRSYDDILEEIISQPPCSSAAEWRSCIGKMLTLYLVILILQLLNS